MPLLRSIAFPPAIIAALAWSAIASAATTVPALTYPASGAIASGTRAAAIGPWALAPGEYYSELSGSSFKTRSAFDDAGDRTTYAGQTQEREFRSYTELGWKKKLSVVISLPFLEHTNRPETGLPLSINSLGDFGLGLKWSLANGASATAAQFVWEAPAGYNSHLTPAAGDGLQKLSWSLQFGGRLAGKGFWQAGAGERFEYLSASASQGQLVARTGSVTVSDARWAILGIANATLAYPAGRWLLAGSYAGDFGVASGSAPDRVSQAAGPRLTYRMDPRIDFFAGSWHTPAGKNSLHVDRFYAGVAWKNTKLNRQQGLIGSDKLP